MARVEDQIEQYLHQGESIREVFDVGPVRVVLTSHRVFASDPDDEGIKQAELPNVTGVTRTRRGSRSGLVWGISLAIIGGAFLAVGFVVGNSTAFSPPEFQENAANEIGAGGLTDVVGLLFWVVENLDTLLLGAGLLCFALAAIPVVNYRVRVRERTLAIELAGERPDIHLPLEYISVEDEFRLEKALVPEQVSDDLQIDSEEDTTAHPDAGGDTLAGGDRETGTNIDEDQFEWVAGDDATDDQVDGTGDP
jgi:hypothetical protein